MKKKLIFIFLACNILIFQIGFLIFGLMNVAMMNSNISFGEALYNTNFNINDFLNETKDYINIKDGQYTIDESRRDILIQNNVWLQILDKDNKEVYNFNKPEMVPSRYTTTELVNYKIYPWKSDYPATIAIDSIEGETDDNTLILGFPIDKVFSYRFTFTNESFNVQIIYGGIIALVLTLIVGYFFSKRLVKPIGDIIDDIETLKDGKFIKARNRDLLFREVDENILELSETLNENNLERENIEKAKEQWIANIAHDLKTPLSSIKGYSELLSSSRYDVTLEDARRYGEIMKDKSEYMQSLIEDLSLIYKLKNRVLPFNLKKNNIVDITRDVVIAILNSLDFSHREVNIHYEDENIEILCDEKYIKRALNNFIINGLVHNPKDTMVDVLIKKANKSVSIIIKDNGLGISEADMKNIFTRYYRGSNTNEGTKSSGLGMAISKEIIEGHGGIVVVSSTKGVGCNINITLDTE